MSCSSVISDIFDDMEKIVIVKDPMAYQLDEDDPFIEDERRSEGTFMERTSKSLMESILPIFIHFPGVVGCQPFSFSNIFRFSAVFFITRSVSPYLRNTNCKSTGSGAISKSRGNRYFNAFLTISMIEALHITRRTNHFR